MTFYDIQEMRDNLESESAHIYNIWVEHYDFQNDELTFQQQMAVSMLIHNAWYALDQASEYLENIQKSK